MKNYEKTTQMAKDLFREERAIMRLDGWFIAREAVMKTAEKYKNLSEELRCAHELCEIVEALPLSVSKNAIFAGTQRDAFARSYALINPSFRVETFSGYCDPTAVYGDIEPNDEFTKERIEAVRSYTKSTDYVKTLADAYEKAEEFTGEVAFFTEQVTGHLIPDLRPALKYGVDKLICDIDARMAEEKDTEKKENYEAMKLSLGCAKRIAQRYAEIVKEQLDSADKDDKPRLEKLYSAISKVPAKGAENLYEAIQSFIILWQIMCIEQAPNPFAFSVGNADRIFEPYRAMEDLSREETAALLKHLLVFFNVADRSWAISQNLIVGGMDEKGNDLTNPTTYALLDAYFDMNLPQPILSVKMHKGTPDKLHAELGRFFFSPGVLTPSLFNDESVFANLRDSGVAEEDLADYSVAGCQEPLIMGKDNGNTTNSWLNMAKILELTLTGGYSTITGKKIGDIPSYDAEYTLKNIRTLFAKNLEYYVDKMIETANNCSKAVSHLRVPFLSAFMGGIESGYDTRDTSHQGTKYNGSGCLIHGVSVVADSIEAIECLVQDRPEDAENLIEAIKCNFERYGELHEYLRSCPKFGNNIVRVDDTAVWVAELSANMVASKRNYLGNPFRADFASPSTHLTYGYWVGATPDGRKSRDMLNYGVDPLYGEATQGMGFRMLSNMKLPFHLFKGGYASHFGIDPKYFKKQDFEGKGLEFRDKIVTPLFFNPECKGVAPFYLYVNVATADVLRKVLANPKKYAPSGVYIMRIHGTFVNFLDLSPAIQQDIITRLDPASTAVC